MWGWPPTRNDIARWRSFSDAEFRSEANPRLGAVVDDRSNAPTRCNMPVVGTNSAQQPHTSTFKLLPTRCQCKDDLPRTETMILIEHRDREQVRMRGRPVFASNHWYVWGEATSLATL